MNSLPHGTITPRSVPSNREEGRDFWLVFAACCLFFFIGLGIRPYLTPSEARYIEIPRQMLATGDWLTPRVNGVPYFDRPPLFFWIQAGVMALPGHGEFAGRLAGAILTALTCASTCAFGRLLYGRESGLLAAGVLASSLMGYGLSRVAAPDAPFGLFITLALGSFLSVLHTEKRVRRRNRCYVMYIAIALAILTRGLVGLAIPLLVISAWIGLQRNWRLPAQMHLLKGMALMLAITLPWPLLMAQTHPAFLDLYSIPQQLSRFAANEQRRAAPWWFYVAVTWVGLLPWSGLLPSVFRALEWRKPDTRFLLLWIGLVLLVYSFSQSKPVTYIFPLFPPLCMLVGQRLWMLWEYRVPLEPLRRSAWLVIAAFAAVLALAPFAWLLPGKLGVRAGTIASLVSAWSLAPVALALLWLLLNSARRCPTPRLIGALMLCGAVAGLNANFIAAQIDRSSVKPLALALTPQLAPPDMVVAYGSYWQDLPVYLNRNVTVAGWTGELSFGVQHYPHTHEWMIAPHTFWKRCALATGAVYVFVGADTLRDLAIPAACPLKPTASFGKTILMKKDAR